MIEQIDNALNESRILVLVVQVFLGFQYQAVFQSGFAQLPRASQHLKLGALSLMLIAFALLISPVAYHRIVEQGSVNRKFHTFITRVTERALLPFAVGLSLEFSVVAGKVLRHTLGLLCGGAALVIALFFWYGIEALFAKYAAEQKGNSLPMNSETTPLKDKIKFVLTEARVVLPGAQALLGFQFAVVLTDGFDKLAPLVKYIHLASLAAVGLSTVLLMAPAAFHRIVEQGEDTERLHTFSSYMVLGAMAFLAIGIAGDVFVVVQKVIHAAQWAWLSSGLTLLVFYGGWFGFTLFRKAAKPVSTAPPVSPSLS